MENFYLEGLGPLETNKVLDKDPVKAVEIARIAAAALQPWGLYDLGVAYEQGYGDVPHDQNLAWAYYLKAAQLGSPEAQMALASAYREAGQHTDEIIMLECAYRQGHGPAAYKLAIQAGVKKQFQEAIFLYQNGVKFGSLECARALAVVFRHGYWGSKSIDERNTFTSMGIGIDIERENRYMEIYDALQLDPDLKLTQLDLTLPLPPAILPPWLGVSGTVEQKSDDNPTY